MFDIGFAEVALIGLVILFVAGPERLPEIARVAGAYLRRIKQLVGEVKADVKKELKDYESQQAKSIIEEVKSDIGEVIPSEDLKAAKEGLQSIKQGAQAAVGGLFEAKNTVGETVRDLKREVSVKEILKSEAQPRPETKPQPASAQPSAVPQAHPQPDTKPETAAVQETLKTAAQPNAQTKPEPDAKHKPKFKRTAKPKRTFRARKTAAKGKPSDAEENKATASAKNPSSTEPPAS